MKSRNYSEKAPVDRLMSQSLESRGVRTEPAAGELYVQLW